MRILQLVLVALLIASLSYWFGEVIGKIRAKAETREEMVKAIRTYIESNDSTMHRCKDIQHVYCDTECSCWGRGCLVVKRDYEIELHGDTVWVFDGMRPVDRYITNWRNQIDSILLKDNQ